MKMKTFWNLKLLYKSDTDPQIEKDLKTIEVACAAFEKKYKNKPFTASPEVLFEALEEREVLGRIIGSSKPWWYFELRKDLNSADAKASALATKYNQRITEATNRIRFFALDIAKIPTQEQQNFLNHAPLKSHQYFLKRIFKTAKFNLSLGEEQLESLLQQPAYDMWIDAQQRLLTQQTVAFKGTQIPIEKALGELSGMNKKDRRETQEKINAVLKSISFMAESEINAVYNLKKVMDTRRGYKKPYSETILGYENDEKAIESFVSLITKKFTISERFYKLHAKLLGEKTITYADRSVKIGKIQTKFDFETSVSILRTVLGNIDKEYLGFFDAYLENGQIDVYPKKGKRGGAYCWGMGDLPTFVLLNHSNEVRSLETLAHEMGHAIHTELSKRQPARYRRYSTATAEVASTFFEQLILEEIEKHLSEKEKIVLLHNKILGDIATIFRQIACFNFELELHEKIRAEGQVSKEKISELLVKHMKSYLGNAVKVAPDDGYFFVCWGHIRRFFYVYTYAYGQLISRALYEKYKQDPSYASKIKQFLSAGGSMSPEDIFKSIGIDTSKTSFFEEGLKGIEKDIARLEKMV